MDTHNISNITVIVKFIVIRHNWESIIVQIEIINKSLDVL